MSDILVSRTAPVELGPQTPENSIPVVISSSADTVISVKQSQPETEVALSLLGIPRAETTLAIFSDITTYGIDTEIWSSFPEVWTADESNNGHGVRFLEYASAARIEAPPGKFAFLNSKRAFPYLPGRVSSSTFGLRSAFENRTSITSTMYRDITGRYNSMTVKPLRKWGQYSDKNGYYFEIRGAGEKDNFKVVRRTNGIDESYILDNYPHLSTTLPENSLYKINSTIKRSPSGIQADGLTYTHAVINDMSMEVLSTLVDAVSVFDPTVGVSRTKFVNQENALVYEYRVPRSWFNADQLNGLSNNPTFYSDVITIDGTQYQPGGLVVDVTDSSVRQIEFDKVTMYKTEYSWYGAIGCIFLAYVPVLETTARWVKAHYLRGSNQLSFPTLGNPYLPMRFYVQNSTENGYSEGIEKYGASYYIDGADKGSVRVFSAVNDANPKVGTGETTLTNTTEWAIYSNNTYPYIKLNNLVVNNRTFLINAYILGTISITKNGTVISREITPGSIYITSVKRDESGSVFVFLNKPIFDNLDSTGVTVVSPSPSNLRIITPRGTTIMGLQMKKTIGPQNVVSKSSIFPIRMNVSNIGESPALLRIMKNARRPLLVSSTGNNGYGGVRQPVTIESDIRETNIEIIAKTTNDFVFNNNNECTVYIRNIPGILKKISRTVLGSFALHVCTFTRYEPGERITLIPVPNSNALGNLNVTSTEYGYDAVLQEAGYIINSTGFTNSNLINDFNSFNTTPDVFSAANYTIDDAVCYLVNTGQQLTTLMTSQNSSDDFDLAPYFGFNKEFLAGSGLSVEYRFSDTLLVVANVLDSTNPSSTSEICLNITWEEQ